MPEGTVFRCRRKKHRIPSCLMKETAASGVLDAAVLNAIVDLRTRN